MSAYVLSALARDDIERLLRRLALAGPRVARRALDELFASMDWLTGEAGPAAAAEAHGVSEGVRLWPLRDFLLAWRPAGEGGDRPAIVVRVLRRDSDVD